MLRYFVLQQFGGPKSDRFYLEQHDDSSPLSKVRKKMDMRRVVRVFHFAIILEVAALFMFDSCYDYNQVILFKLHY